MHPVVGRPITTHFWVPGKRWSLKHHTGVDYACPIGTDVLAPASGYVIRTAYDKSYGNYILLRVIIQGVPYNVYLCHLSQFRVKPGQQVNMGQHIGESGNTGNSSGPHLHMEVRRAPYGFNSRDIVDPWVVYSHSSTLAPTSLVTVWDHSEWNIARERWYTPWYNRADEIKRELWDEASTYTFQELFEAKAINTVKEALPKCNNFSGPAGLEFFFDVSPDRWTKYFGANLRSPIPNRWAQKVTLKRNNTGQLVDFFNVHAPIKAEGAGAKEAYGKWLANLVRQAANPVVIAGDFNYPNDSGSPKKELRALGYIGFKEQAQVTNENVKEFIPKKQDLCDIRTHPAGEDDADVRSGEVDISTNSLESDHRRLEARIVIAA